MSGPAGAGVTDAAGVAGAGVTAADADGAGVAGAGVGEAAVPQAPSTRLRPTARVASLMYRWVMCVFLSFCPSLMSIRRSRIAAAGADLLEHDRWPT